MSQDSRPCASSNALTPIAAISAGSRIPPELIDDIIGIAAQAAERESYKQYRSICANFSLVGRSWLPASRYHLLKHGVWITLEMAKTLNALMQSPNATVASHIPYIVIHPSLGKPTMTDEILRLIPPLPSLQTLVLRHDACFSCASMDRETLRLKFQSIKHLELFEGIFDTFDHLATFLSSFPHLDRVKLWHITWSRTSPMPVFRCLPMSFCNLSVYRGYSLDFLNFLRLTDSLPPLHTLELRWDAKIQSGSGSNTLDQILHTLGPSLLHLSITEHESMKPDSIDLSHNTELHTICITYLTHKPGEVVSLEWIPPLLARVRSHRVEVVELKRLETYFMCSQGIDTPGSIDPSSLFKVDKALNEPQFRNLRRVTFCGEWRETKVDEYMPLCHSRGILSMSVS